MGQRGPKPKSTALHKIDGTRPYKKHVNEPRPSELIGTIDPPDWLTDAACEIWRDVLPKLQAYRMVTDLDLRLIAKYCQCQAFYAQDVAFLAHKKSSGYTSIGVSDQEIIKEWPQVASSQRYAKLVMQLGDSLGLSPTARTRISLPYPAPTKRPVVDENRFVFPDVT